MPQGSTGSLSSLIELLRDQADHQPDRVVYDFSAEGEAGGESLTLGMLDARARAIAAWLQLRGVEGQRALLLFPPGLEFITAFLAVFTLAPWRVPASHPPTQPAGGNRAENPSPSRPPRPAVLMTTADQLLSTRQWLTQVPDLSQAHWLGSRRALTRQSRPTLAWAHGAGYTISAFLQWLPRVRRPHPRG